MNNYVTLLSWYLTWIYSIIYFTKHQLMAFWIALMIIDVLAKMFINTLGSRQNARHFPDDILKFIFNENAWISIKISVRFFRMGPVNNIPVLVQITSWCNYLNQWWLFVVTDRYMRHSTLMRLLLNKRTLTQIRTKITISHCCFFTYFYMQSQRLHYAKITR